MQQDRHYKIAKSLILDGTIKTFGDIFEYVPKTNVAKDFKMHYDTLQKRIIHPGKLTLEELTKLSELIEIDPMVIIKLAYMQYENNKKIKRKR
jgi:hypothetical protein